MGTETRCEYQDESDTNLALGEPVVSRQSDLIKRWIFS